MFLLFQVPFAVRELSKQLILIRELKQRRFLAAHVNRKRGIFHFKIPRRYKICITKFLYYYGDDLRENLGKTTAHELA